MPMAIALTITADEIAHAEQLDVWAEEMCWALMGWLKEPESYDDKIALANAIKSELSKVVEIAVERCRHTVKED